ncbi:MAG: cytochrome B [Alphaproteobacteria bacterium]|nr:MAG: cytochrome B [Alphaproteobacteria bacterium]
MLRSLYNWTLDKAEHPRALWILAAFSFAESSFFPIPPDILLIPMVLAAPTRAWRIALVCSIASVFGGIFGYYIGYALFETAGQPIIDFYGMQEKFIWFQAKYNEWGAWIVGLAGFTPIPYKVFTIASGLTQLDLTTFIVASALSRAARFFLVAALLWKFGTPIRIFIEKRLGLLTLLFFALLAGSFLALKYV